MIIPRPEGTREEKKQKEKASITSTTSIVTSASMDINSHRLVIVWFVGVSQIEDDRAVRPSPTPLRELAQEVNAPVERKATIGQDINPLGLEVRRRVDNTNATSLDKVVGDEQVLLIRADLDVVGSDDTLVLVGVVETLDVVQVGDVERGDVVADGEREVGEFAVVGDVRVDGEVVAGAGTEVEEELGNTLLALRVLAERVDDPDLAGADGGGESSGLGVTWDEFDVLDTLAVGDGDGRNDLAGAEFPETKGIGLLDANGASGLEDRHGHDEVGSEDDVLVEVD